MICDVYKILTLGNRNRLLSITLCLKQLKRMDNIQNKSNIHHEMIVPIKIGFIGHALVRSYDVNIY
jgi:hypothetical protein